MHVFGFLVTVLLAAASSADLPPNGANPAAVAAVMDKSFETANASWWGFDPADSTAFLQAAIDSGAKKVVVPYMGTPWIVTPIKLRSDLEVAFEPGVGVLAKRNEFKGKGDSLFTIADGRNVTLIGYGATLRMWKQDYQKEPYEKAEWRMCLDIVGSTNILIEGLRCESSGGDGIYVGCTDKQPYCENVVIRNVVCHDNHRQGISVIGAKNLLIENCVLSGTSGTAPMAGIDFEPNGPGEQLVDCVMRNCFVENKDGGGIVAYLKPLSAETKPVSLLIENCYVRGGKNAGLAVGAVAGVKGSIEFRNCTVEDTNHAGAYVYDKNSDAASVRFTNCRWRNIGMDRETAPILLHARRTSVSADIGGITFDRCSLYDCKDRPAVAIDGKDRSIEARGITGDIVVYTPYEARADIKLKAVDTDINLKKEPPLPEPAP